jgi:predicted membrane protein
METSPNAMPSYPPAPIRVPSRLLRNVLGVVLLGGWFAFCHWIQLSLVMTLSILAPFLLVGAMLQVLGRLSNPSRKVRPAALRPRSTPPHSK